MCTCQVFINRLWHKASGVHPKGEKGKDNRYMHTISSGCSNQIPPNINTSTSIAATPPTAVTTAITSNLLSMSSSTPAPDPIKAKWVKNLSSRPLTEA